MGEVVKIFFFPVKFSLYEIPNTTTRKTKKDVDVLRLVFKTLCLGLFSLHQHLRPAWEIFLSLSASSQHKAEHRGGPPYIPELTLDLVT